MILYNCAGFHCLPAKSGTNVVNIVTRNREKRFYLFAMLLEALRLFFYATDAGPIYPRAVA